MDALEFLKERSRMCKSYGTCVGCPVERGNCGLGANTSNEEYERIIAAVEQWSKEHPRKTRQSVFLEQYPEAVLDGYGVITICPAKIFKAHRSGNRRCNSQGKLCIDCRREFWMQEVE